jgi:membrane-bound serine protease (ClpP class)
MKIPYNDCGEALDSSFIPFPKRKTMNILLNPNVAYLVLVLGFFTAILALFAPGTGLLELGALVLLVLSGYAIYNLPINGWALVVLVVGVLPFLWGLRRSRQPVFLITSVVAMAVGSVFLFRSETGGAAVNPVLAAIVSITIPLFLWFVARKSIQAMQMKPTHDLGDLIGKVGEARTDISNEGSVYVGGESWSARSAAPIKNGSPVRVIGREGLILEVEAAPAPLSAAVESPTAETRK